MRTGSLIILSIHSRGWHILVLSSLTILLQDVKILQSYIQVFVHFLGSISNDFWARLQLFINKLLRKPGCVVFATTRSSLIRPIHFVHEGPPLFIAKTPAGDYTRCCQPKWQDTDPALPEGPIPHPGWRVNGLCQWLLKALTKYRIGQIYRCKFQVKRNLNDRIYISHAQHIQYSEPGLSC